MIPEKSLAVYKNRPALVNGKEGDKIIIAVYESGKSPQEFKVREKDIEIIHPGPLTDLNGIATSTNWNGVQGDSPLVFETADAAAAREAWELLAGEQSGSVSLKELAELAFGEYSPAAAWAVFRLLLDGLYFTGNAAALSPRSKDEVETEEKKRQEKQRESGERERFLDRLKKCRLELPGDGRFIQDVEALAYGKSPKSRTMKDLGLSETPEDAHALLLETNFWTAAVNPHPARFGLSMVSAKCIPEPPPAEERRDLTRLAAFAIDSPWSNDPDDAVSLEKAGPGRYTLYVHVADPASSVTPDSPPEREARDRGATLYLPEGSFRMLAEEALPLFALGLSEQSPALTFKITIDEKGEIASTDIFPSIVKVQRLSYEEADKLIDSGTETSAVILRDLCTLAEGNLRRRIAAGAIHIELPDTHITVSEGRVNIEPIVSYRSADLVRECMLLAGEGAGLWAAGIRGESAGEAGQSIPFPYISQEEGDLPKEILPGMAGSYQLRRCMRPRALSIKPGRHWGLGLSAYTQVTSPLRRYTDLLSHMQIRSLLRSRPDRPALSADEAALRLGAGEAAAAATVQVERASRLHWTMVYLSDKKDLTWDAVALEKKGSRWALMLPALALETQVSLRNDPVPNEHIELTLKSVHIPKGEAVFTASLQ